MIITIRYLQLMGSLCLIAFCRHFGIRHQLISDLIAHQVELLRCNDLIEWSNSGRRLAITGMGDPIPDAVAQCVPGVLMHDFQCLVDSVTEIGVVDLFGKNTSNPFRFLLKCCSLLEMHHVPIPITGAEIAIAEWGEPLDEESFKNLINRFSSDLQGYYSITTPKTPRG